MTEYTLIKPESFTEFKKHLKYIRYLHLVYEPTIEMVKGYNTDDDTLYPNVVSRKLYVYTQVDRKIKGIKSSYWMIYEIPNDVYIHINQHTKYTTQECQRKPIHIYINEYAGIEEFKTVINTFNETKDNLTITVWSQVYDEKFEKEHNVYISQVTFANKRNGHKNSIYGEYDDNTVCKGTYTHIRTNIMYNQIIHVDEDDNSRACNDVKWIHENINNYSIYI
jgi:hypothetical protein